MNKLHPNTAYLRAAIIKAGISHKQAGELVGRSKNTIGKYCCEQGGRVIPDDLLEALDDALHKGKHQRFKPKLKFINEGDNMNEVEQRLRAAIDAMNKAADEMRQLSERFSECATRLAALSATIQAKLGAERAHTGSDDGLPGLWSHADFTGGDPDERSHAERASGPAAPLPAIPDPDAAPALREPPRPGEFSDEPDLCPICDQMKLSKRCPGCGYEGEQL